jgi:hypothetical protein
VSSRALYLLDQGWPVILSDFGADNRGGNVNDNHFYGCAAAVAADLDLDWALWMLQGSYYLREGVLDVRAAGRVADPAGQPEQDGHQRPPARAAPQGGPPRRQGLISPLFFLS